MVQLLVCMVAPPESIQDVVSALRAVMRPALQARECSSARIYRPVNDDRRVDYIEEWNDIDEFRRQIQSERFVQLLGVLEMASERPLVEFRVISETHGLEYVTSVRSGVL
jgi:quinol monooxygenase YgiN